MIIWKRLAGIVVAIACCGGLAACGGSNPAVSSADFVNYCVNQNKSNKNLPPSINLSTTCQCVQQKLVAGGFGNLKANDLKNNSAAERAAAPCVTSVTSTPPTPSTPSIPSTPSTTTT